MKNKLRFLLIFCFSIFLISCTFGKSIKNDSALENQSNIKKTEEEIEKDPDTKITGEANKNSNEISEEKKIEETSQKSNETIKVEDKKITSEKSNIDNEENEAVASNNKKIIYLTFDDGPSNIVTNKILDTLKENNVNGTFFLIGNQIKGREKIVKRIYNEGNGIGLHSYTHNYKKIYSNDDIFIKEMSDCRNEVKRVVGISPNIIRFPGGSSKRLSKSFLNKLHEKKLKVYDWNLDNCDGLKPKTSPEELYEKAIEGKGKKKKIILLLHCGDVHDNTYKALNKIIKFYKSKGYEFRIITEETAELYFPIIR